MSYLLACLLNEDLNEEVYMAQEAGLSFSAYLPKVRLLWACARSRV